MVGVVLGCMILFGKEAQLFKDGGAISTYDFIQGPYYGLWDPGPLGLRETLAAARMTVF